MAMGEGLEGFKMKAQDLIQGLIQDTVNEEFTLAIGANRVASLRANIA